VYPRSKFVSEFGFQSYPSFSILKNVTAPEDRSYTSAFMNYRCCNTFCDTNSILS
jgi:beta-mannosidase